MNDVQKMMAKMKKALDEGVPESTPEDIEKVNDTLSKLHRCAPNGGFMSGFMSAVLSKDGPNAHPDDMYGMGKSEDKKY